jgi:hypothetical protein
MPLGTNAETANITGRDGSLRELQPEPGDISGGVEAAVGDVQSLTLYLSASGAVEVTVEASADGGENYFTLPESPVVFGGAGDDAVLINYDMNRIKLTGSDGTNVQALLREVV